MTSYGKFPYLYRTRFSATLGVVVGSVAIVLGLIFVPVGLIVPDVVLIAFAVIILFTGGFALRMGIGSLRGQRRDRASRA